MSAATPATVPDIAAVQAMVEPRIAEMEAHNAPSAVAQPEPERRPLQVDISAFSGNAYLNAFPPRYEWLLDKSLRRACLGAIVGPPGAGKGTFAIQLAVAVAAGLPFLDIWPIPASGPALYLSAEDDAAVIHRRAHHALKQLPEGERAAAAANFYGVAVHGQVNLCSGGRGAEVVKTLNMDDLRAMLEKVRPALLVLDTLSRFSSLEEQDNPGMTAFCGMLEVLIADYGCNIILLHHSNKAAGDCVEKPDALALALSQTAIRGASALAGCIRWGLLMAPLGAGLAGKIIGDDARGRPDGSFVACRVAKKNAGAPEPRHYLGRDSQGLLYRVEATGQAQAEGDATADAYKLAEEVKRREVAGEKPLALTKGGQNAFSWGIGRSEKAGKKAVELGLLVSIPKGHGNILGSVGSAGSDTAGTNKTYNDDEWLSLGSGVDGSEGAVP